MVTLEQPLFQALKLPVLLWPTVGTLVAKMAP